MDQVVVVNAANRELRARARLVRVDDRFVYVELLGEEKRFSRSTGFEVPLGGGWGKFRLSGKDMRRLQR